MEQTAITLPTPSLITSNSISFQPAMYLSTRICVIGLSISPCFATRSSSSLLCATPPPASVNAGLIITGYPIFSAIFSAVSMSFAISEGTTGCPSFNIVSRKSCLSSALSIACASVPSRRTPILSRYPSFASCIEMVSPVWPPRPPKMLSGLSFSIMRLTVSSVSGSR